MANIFLSCSRLDNDRVKPVADRLSSLGYTVWWDKAPDGQALSDETERQLDAARAVLVIWTHNSANASSVFAQACAALDAGNLVQAKLEGIDRPAPFHALNAADIGGERAEWGPLEDALARLVRGGEAQESAAPVMHAGLFAAPSAAGLPKLLTIALAAALAAYAGAIVAGVNGVMAPEQLQIAAIGMFGVAGICAALLMHRLNIVMRAGG